MEHIREEILQEAVEGTSCTGEWAAMQTVRLYRGYIQAGQPHDEALTQAKQEMVKIKDEALRIRREAKLQEWRNNVAPWCVIALGVLAAYGWWSLWE
ncbi:hypothetical protein [Myxococcus sp. CA039A]|uniref:hypothetical protein n=1 Tax=Myxococcus sp. CA039A TaxID=2741737 RepID=UPI00157B0EB8|nr:hypothetical protein [Myxococcus sp. CA039A]NTX58764.1 hypothetical protein [Myxococcus sp. CA039A]